ncbi:MAG: long-chain fatty acid--CoA ligase [Thermoleophilaceae bacterium]|nr:long-chain fatty acid--CoA ligase [Thermoleophilaceae bacterium]
MEAVRPAASGTGSRSMADLAWLAAEKYAGQRALTFKRDDGWLEVSYEELGRLVSEVGRGLIDLGLEHGDKVSILSHTRPEWTYANLAILSAGTVSVSIYQTNSAQECRYVLEHSESKAVFVEDVEQLAKVREVEDDLPHLEHIVIFDAPRDREGLGSAITLTELRERGGARPEADLAARREAVTADDTCVTIYTSGTTGPPKGCLISHGNYRDVTNMTIARGVGGAEEEVVYLFLPLAHAFAKLVQFVTIDMGGAIAYWEKDPQKIVPNLMEVRPTYFPSVPRMFEKVYTLATTAAEDTEKLEQAVQVGVEVRQMQAAGREVPAGLQAAFDGAEEKLYANVRALFGGRIRQCVTGAAPIAPEILEFFYACGIPVMEAYGMTETSTVATANIPADFRFGSVGKALPGVETKLAADGELLLKGPNIFTGYYKNQEATEAALVDGWLHTGDIGRIDGDGFVYITGRKKDIIITAGGKNITPTNLENGLKQSRWISQAVVIGDRRPYLVALITVDPEEGPAFAEQHGLDVEDVAVSEEMRAEVQLVVEGVNAQVGSVERIKKFAILPRDFTQETGELTPTLKVKRNVVNETHGDAIEALYSG